MMRPMGLWPTAPPTAWADIPLRLFWDMPLCLFCDMLLRWSAVLVAIDKVFCSASVFAKAP